MDLINYDKLQDSEIKTYFETNNPYTVEKEMSAIITFELENVEEKTTNLSKRITCQVSNSDVFNINYKLKSAVNQINEFVKNFNS